MGIEKEIQVAVASADILLVTAGYILIRVIIVIIVVIFVAGIILIIRRIYRGS